MTTQFDAEPVVIGGMATSYGELRARARSTREETDVVSIIDANPALVASAIRGLCIAIEFLLDRLEEQTREEAEK